MKVLSFLPVLLLLMCSSARAGDEATLRAADDARVAAMKAADGAKLAELFSDELHYAHSSGAVDTKASFMDALTSGKSKYTGIDYEERKFTFPAPGVALMTGRARVQVTSAKGQMDAVLSFLAVWREENGKWRFLAWQSCKMPPAAQ
jgi:ketosteroid isomerase-like protein